MKKFILSLFILVLLVGTISAFEFDNVMIGLQLWQFEELFNAVSKTKSAIEKRQMYE